MQTGNSAAAETRIKATLAVRSLGFVRQVAPAGYCATFEDAGLAATEREREMETTGTKTYLLCMTAVALVVGCGGEVSPNLHAAPTSEWRLVDRAVPVLGGTDHAEPRGLVAVEGQHDVDQVLEDARSGDGALLGDVADQDGRDVAAWLTGLSSPMNQATNTSPPKVSMTRWSRCVSTNAAGNGPIDANSGTWWKANWRPGGDRHELR